MNFHRLIDGNLELGLFGNTWERWIASGSVTFAIFLFTVALRGLLVARLRKRARNTETRWDDSLLVMLESIREMKAPPIPHTKQNSARFV